MGRPLRPAREPPRPRARRPARDRGLNALVERIRASRPPDGVATRIVAIDGHGGAGKSTFAEKLSAALGGAPVAHTDDFASWQVPVDWWPRCLRELLEPLARGEAAHYEVSQWGDAPRPPVTIEPGGTVILEGVTASREAFRPYLAFAIWIETPREVCLRRGIERDGESARTQWETWFAGEDAYVARERPRDHVDAIVPGV